jgi:hypothetical protein
MPPVQDDILNTFCTKLSNAQAIDPAMVEALRKVLSSAKKLKADEVVALLSKAPRGVTP